MVHRHDLAALDGARTPPGPPERDGRRSVAAEGAAEEVRREAPGRGGGLRIEELGEEVVEGVPRLLEDLDLDVVVVHEAGHAGVDLLAWQERVVAAVDELHGAVDLIGVDEQIGHAGAVVRDRCIGFGPDRHRVGDGAAEAEPEDAGAAVALLEPRRAGQRGIRVPHGLVDVELLDTGERDPHGLVRVVERVVRVDPTEQVGRQDDVAQAGEPFGHPGDVLVHPEDLVHQHDRRRRRRRREHQVAVEGMAVMRGDRLGPGLDRHGAQVTQHRRRKLPLSLRQARAYPDGMFGLVETIRAVAGEGRAVLVDHGDWMAWNTLLATVPLFLANVPVRKENDRTWTWWVGTVAFVAFLPNAPYVLTDVVHLVTDIRRGHHTDLEVLFLVVPLYLVFFTAGFGCYVLALQRLRLYLRVTAPRGGAGGRWRRGCTACARSGCTWSCPLRFNSWDIVVSPGRLIGTADTLTDTFPMVAMAVMFVILVVLTVLFDVLIEGCERRARLMVDLGREKAHRLGLI